MMIFKLLDVLPHACIIFVVISQLIYRECAEREEEQNREEGEMAQKKVGRREKKKCNHLGRREKLAQKSREEGEIGSESREKGDLPPVPPPPFRVL